MSMFDDHNSEDEQLLAAINGRGKSESTDGSDSQDEAATYDSASEASGSDSDDEEQQPQAGSRKKKKVDVVEHIFDSRRGSAGSKRGAGPAGGAGGGPGGAAAAAQAAQAADLARLQQERKRFMSAKAAVLAGDGPQQPQAGRRRRSSSGGAPSLVAASADGEGLSREEFLQIHREVQLLGEEKGLTILGVYHAVPVSVMLARALCGVGWGSCRRRTCCNSEATSFFILAARPPGCLPACLPARLPVRLLRAQRRAFWGSSGRAALRSSRPPHCFGPPWGVFSQGTWLTRCAAVPRQHPCGHIVRPSAEAENA